MSAGGPGKTGIAGTHGKENDQMKKRLAILAASAEACRDIWLPAVLPHFKEIVGK